MAPLPDARNPLLGRWRVEGGARSRKKDDMSTLMGMLNNPGGAMCEALFGSGVTEFKPKTWSSIDSYGDDSLGPIHYRGEGKVVWAVPESKMFNFFGFEFASPDRMTLVGVERCTLVRAGAAAPSATTARAGKARARRPQARRRLRQQATTASGLCCACAADVNAVAPVAGGLPQHAARQDRKRRRQSGARDVGRALQGSPPSKARCRTRTTCASTCAAAPATTRASRRRCTTSTPTACCSRSPTSGDASRTGAGADLQ